MVHFQFIWILLRFCIFPRKSHFFRQTLMFEVIILGKILRKNLTQCECNRNRRVKRRQCVHSFIRSFKHLRTGQLLFPFYVFNFQIATTIKIQNDYQKNKTDPYHWYTIFVCTQTKKKKELASHTPQYYCDKEYTFSRFDTLFIAIVNVIWEYCTPIKCTICLIHVLTLASFAIKAVIE